MIMLLTLQVDMLSQNLAFLATGLLMPHRDAALLNRLNYHNGGEVRKSLLLLMPMPC